MDCAPVYRVGVTVCIADAIVYFIVYFIFRDE